MQYIAHFRETDKAIHELSVHLLEVAAKCDEYGSRIGIGKIARLAGVLHDMGKFSDEFQDYIRSKMNTPMQDNQEEPLSKIDHGKIGALYIFNKFHDSCSVSEKILSEILAMVISYHHGGLNDFITMDCQVPLLNRLKPENLDTQYYTCINRFFDIVCSEKDIDSLFSEACNELNSIMRKVKTERLSVSFTLHLLIKHLYSIVIDCDRLDTYLFMEGIEELPCLDTSDLWKNYLMRLEDKINELKAKPTNTILEERIKKLRLKVSDECADFAQRERGIYLLTVPTGGGKTFSSLRFALKHAIKHGMKKIIYVLPFTTIIEQNASVVRNALNCADNLLEHHCNVIQTEHEKYKLLVQRWDCPIIFTTMVQFLNTFFESGTVSIRRFHQLDNSILIFDEIQALPIKCISLFNDTINYLNKICHCTIVLSSATQPNLSEVVRPIMISDSPNIISNPAKLFTEFKRMNVIPRLIEGGYTLDMVVDFVYSLKALYKSVLVILNTKKAAEKIYKVAEERNVGNINLYYLSTNLCPAHRKKVISEIKDKLKSNEHIICISTQLIEAGVDISFETVIRSLAGLDSVAQASGRGNRHGEGEIKETYIINVRDEVLKNLKEIELGQKHTRTILHEYSNNPEKFDNDLLSPAAILQYYKYYYSDSEISTQMDYYCKEINEKLYSILSGQKQKEMAYEDLTGKQYPFQLLHMFRTAADNFRVIDDNTRTVLVPYGEGRRIITDLLGSKSLSEKLECLKELQQYAVNIFESQFRLLEEKRALNNSPIDGVLILKDGFYHSKLGVIEESNMELLLYE